MGAGVPTSLPRRVATLPAQSGPEPAGYPSTASPTAHAGPTSYAAPTSYSGPASTSSPAHPASAADAAGTASTSSLPAQSGTPPTPQPAHPEDGARRRRPWRRAPVVVSSVVLLCAVVGAGVVAMRPPGATAADQTVHLAGPLARASGGVASPAELDGSLRSPPGTGPPAAAQRAAPGLCQDSAPPGASSTTLSYIAATNAVVPQWTAISRALGKNGDQARPQDFLSEMKADSYLLERLDEISFTGHAAALAANFETSVRKYVLQLGRVARHGATPSATATLNRLYHRRDVASGLLRTALGLSPEYACQWLRPGTDFG